jgi:hypothetical protein
VRRRGGGQAPADRPRRPTRRPWLVPVVMVALLLLMGLVAVLLAPPR